MNLPATGAILMAIGIALGAFGAHGLQDKLTEKYMAAYQTGVLYHLIHALGILLIGLLAHHNPSPLIPKAGALMLLGMLLFSGSLYALSITGISKLGIITPLGGLSFIAAWILLALSYLKT